MSWREVLALLQFFQGGIPEIFEVSSGKLISELLVLALPNNVIFLWNGTMAIKDGVGRSRKSKSGDPNICACEANSCSRPKHPEQPPYPKSNI